MDSDFVNRVASVKTAAYEVALRAKRPLRAGDKVSYYITGEKKTVKAFETARPLREFDPANPDYNVAYYVKKLDENLKKVHGFAAVAEGGAKAQTENQEAVSVDLDVGWAIKQRAHLAAGQERQAT